MAYTPVPTVTTGDLWTASLHNTYCRDNFAQTSPAIVTAAGDMTYAATANTVTRLPIVRGSVLTSDDALPEWLTLNVGYNSVQGKIGGDGLRFFGGNIGAFIYAYNVNNTVISSSYTALNFNYNYSDSELTLWTSSLPSRMIIPSNFPANRWYRVTGYFHWSGPEVGQKNGLCELRFGKNGTTLFGGQSGNFYGLTDVIHMNASYYIKLTPGDYIELIAYHKNTADLRAYQARLSCFMEVS